MNEILTFSLWGVSLTNWLGVLLYWLPLALCAYGYTIRTWVRYQKDYRERADSESVKAGYRTYIPSLTVGSILGYILMTITPVANLFAAIFDVAPKVFSSLINFLEKVFSQPLVPKRKHPQE